MSTSVFISNSSSSELENTVKEMEITSLINESAEKPTLIHTKKPSSGRKKTSKVNEPTQKKQRRRGMGVEQLEKLRIKKMTEINNPMIHSLLSFQKQPFTTLTVPTTPPVPFGVEHVGFHVQQSSAMMVQGLRMNGVVHNHGPVVSSDPGSAFLAAGPFGVGSVFHGTDQSSSKYFSSKKYCGSGENISCNCDFANVGNKGNILNRENPCYYSSKPTGQEVEMMGVHQKGITTGGGGRMLMEYEFFPAGKFGGSYCNYKQLINMASSSSNYQNGFGEGSNAIDLSLKL